MTYTYDEAYYLLYFTLKDYFFGREKDESLAMFCSAMSPSRQDNGHITKEDVHRVITYEDCLNPVFSMDPAYISDWRERLGEKSFPEKMSEEEAFSAALCFTAHYHDCYDMPSEKVMTVLKTEGRNCPEWKKSVAGVNNVLAQAGK